MSGLNLYKRQTVYHERYMFLTYFAKVNMGVNEKMDFGEAKFFMSRHFSQQPFIVKSEKMPCYAYTFHNIGPRTTNLAERFDVHYAT